jgi:hypothetical protein
MPFSVDACVSIVDKELFKQVESNMKPQGYRVLMFLSVQVTPESDLIFMIRALIPPVKVQPRQYSPSARAEIDSI